jgi:hypothetical protein
MLYPPFKIVIKATDFNMGYAFIFTPPHKGSIIASIYAPVLFAQWAVTILVSAVFWLLTNSGVAQITTEPRERNTENKTLTEGLTFMRTLKRVGVTAVAFFASGIFIVL